MNDLVSFLKARLDEDESYARAAVQTSTRWVPYVGGLGSLDGVSPFGGPGADSSGIQDYDGNLVASTNGRPYPSQSQVRHIVRHDPARVLREVEAKRRLVERLETGDAGHRGNGTPAATLGDAVRLLALPYAWHADYQPEWHPK